MFVSSSRLSDVSRGVLGEVDRGRDADRERQRPTMRAISSEPTRAGRMPARSGRRDGTPVRKSTSSHGRPRTRTSNSSSEQREQQDADRSEARAVEDRARQPPARASAGSNRGRATAAVASRPSSVHRSGIGARPGCSAGSATRVIANRVAPTANSDLNWIEPWAVSPMLIWAMNAGHRLHALARVERELRLRAAGQDAPPSSRRWRGSWPG